MHEALILTKSVVSKNQNNHYHNISLGKCAYQLVQINEIFFDSIIMLRSGRTKGTKEKFYDAENQ